jgi:hypothetical protein
MSAIERLKRSFVASARFYGRNFAQAMGVVGPPAMIRALLARDCGKPGVKIPNDERALFPQRTRLVDADAAADVHQ